MALTLACACGGTSTPVVRPLLPSAPPREWNIPAGDVTLHMRAAGGQDGDPVLIIVNDGPGLSHHYATALEPILAGERRVVTFDQRGVGQSSAPFTERYTLQAFVDDLEYVRGAAHTNQAHLIGHGFGGVVVLAYTAAHPEYVASILLVDSFPAEGNELLAARQRAVARGLALSKRGLWTVPAPAVGNDCTENTKATSPLYFSNPQHPLAHDMSNTTCRVDAGRATEQELHKFDLRSTLSRQWPHIPTLIIEGEGDPFGVAVADQLLAAMPWGTKLILPACGHMPWLECPALFTPPVRRFFDRREE